MLVVNQLTSATIMNEIKKKTWLDWYERIFDNILRVLWLVLLVTWIVTEHRL